MYVFYEKNIVNNNIDKHQKRNMIFNVIKIASIVILCVEIFLILCFQVIPEGEGALAVVLSFTISFLIITPPILSILIFTRLIAKLNAEYDYYVIGDLFRVVQVIDRKKRKKIVEFPLTAISNIGLIKSENFEKFDADKNIKKINAFCNDDEMLGYFFYSFDEEKKLIILEFNLDFLLCLKKALSSMIFDDSVKTLLLQASKSKGEQLR